MTKTEAIDILVGVIATNSEEENEALDLAIEALGQTECEDCISREKILEHAYVRDGVLSVSVDTIKLAPSVTPTERVTETMIVDGMEIEIDPLSYEVGYTHGQFSERLKGEWIDTSEGTFCSECDFKTNEYYNYCPNCNADMRGEGND